jgi:hypothetical protein
MGKEVAKMSIEIAYDEDGKIYLLANDLAQVDLIQAYVSQIKEAVLRPYKLQKLETEMKISGI